MGFAVGIAMVITLPWRAALGTWLVMGAVTLLVTLSVELSVRAQARAAGVTQRPRLRLVALSVVAWPAMLPGALGYWLTRDVPLSPEAERFLAEAASEFQEKQDALGREWRFGAGGDWGFDQATGVFTLRLPDGAEARAEGQMLGSHQASDQTWEWAWNNPHVDPAVARDSALVRDMGAKLGIAYLAAGKIPAPTPHAAHYFASIGVKAAGAQGAYVGPAGSLEVVVLLKGLRWVKPPA